MEKVLQEVFLNLQEVLQIMYETMCQSMHWCYWPVNYLITRTRS